MAAGMRFNYRTFLQNKYVLYLLFMFVLLQLIVFLQCGDMYNAALLLAIGLIVSYFQKNMIVVLFSTLVATHLVKWFLSAARIREGVDETTVPASTTTTSASTSGSTSGSSTTLNMSAQDIKKTIEEQDAKKKELATDINTLYLNNQKEIATLVGIKQDLENKQASLPT